MGPECPPRFGILEEGAKSTKRIQTSVQDPEALRPSKTRRIERKDKVTTPGSQGVVGEDEIGHQEDRQVVQEGVHCDGGVGHQEVQVGTHEADPQRVVCGHKIGH